MADEAEGIRMHEGSIRIPEIQFECSREHSDTERDCCMEGIRMLRRGIQIYIEAIRILEDSIRMLAT